MRSRIASSQQSARGILLAIWFGGFVINLAIIGLVYARGWIHSSSLQLAARQLNDLYAPYLGSIALYYWGTRDAITKAKKSGEDFDRTGFLFAVGASTLWNVAIIAFVVPLAFDTGTIEEVLDNLRTIIGLFPWLVGGAIGYYFGRPGTAATEKVKK